MYSVLPLNETFPQIKLFVSVDFTSPVIINFPFQINEAIIIF